MDMTYYTETEKRRDDFNDAVVLLQREIYSTASAAGWHENWNDSEKLLLVHSEISEGVEAMRDGNPPDKHLPQYDSLTVELADAVIRILDFAEHNGLELAAAIFDKAEYNKSRPYKHGGKVF